MDDVLVDLPTLDRDVRRAAEKLAQARSRLGTKDERDAARALDPFAGVRHVAGKTTYDAIAALPDTPHRDGLLRWIHELLQARIGWDLEVDDADATNEEDERLAKRRGPEGPAATYEEAWRRVLVEAPDRDPAGALERAGELADGVAAVRKERRARRFEAARRLGLDHPFALSTKASVTRLVADANALLDRTDAIAKDVLTDAAKKKRGAWRAADAIHLALAGDAREGWPAKLNARWLAEAFARITTRTVAPRHLPDAIGGASFLRAAAAYGRALRVAGTPRGLPFAVAFDPYPTAEHRFGDALAIAVAEPAFQRRVLGLAARSASTQARSLRISLLLAARTTAMRFLLAASEDGGVARFEELAVRVLGAPMPRGLAGAWPEPDPAEPSRFLGAVTAHAFTTTLRDRFDEDWFSNPRAGAHLAAIASAPAFDPDVPADDAAARIGRAFEEALG